MFGEFDHAGYLVRDIERAVTEVCESFGLTVVRNVELPQFGITAAFVGEGSATIEIFTMTDRAALDARLGETTRMLDHIAFRVSDLDTLAATLALAGARFSGPDHGAEINAPLELGGARHLWTLPETTAGVAVQLSERAPE